MWCESCNAADATVHIIDAVTDRRTEKHLCEHCAEENIGLPRIVARAGRVLGTGNRLLDRLLETCLARPASELRLISGRRPAVVMAGEVRELEMPAMDRLGVLSLAKAAASADDWQRLKLTGIAGFELEPIKGVRFTFSAYTSAAATELVIRRA